MQDEATAVLYGSPKHHHISEDDDELANGNHIHSRDLDIDENIRDPVEDRRTLAERSERLHDQLRVSEQSKLIELLIEISPHCPDTNRMFLLKITGIETRFGPV